MVRIATECINFFFLCINVAKFAISVWQFSPHCVVKFTIGYSTNYKTVWKSIMCVAKIPRVPVENQITTLSVVKIATKFSPCSVKGYERSSYSIFSFAKLFFHFFKIIRTLKFLLFFLFILTLQFLIIF